MQDLLVTSVLANPGSLTVQVVDGSGERNAITFHVDDPVRRGELLTQLRAWLGDRRPVTYVRSRGDGELVDEQRLLARARGDEEWA